jgi:hypothetical protein
MSIARPDGQVNEEKKRQDKETGGREMGGKSRTQEEEGVIKVIKVIKVLYMIRVDQGMGSGRGGDAIIMVKVVKMVIFVIWIGHDRIRVWRLEG